MLVEIEQKVAALSELSVHNENLLLEGKAHTKDEAEQLALKLRGLKGSLQELQRALHDKQLSMQVRRHLGSCGKVLGSELLQPEVGQEGNASHTCTHKLTCMCTPLHFHVCLHRCTCMHMSS